MHLTVEQIYPADVSAVAAMLSDAEFVRWRGRRRDAGAASHVDVSGDPASGFTVSLRRTLPTDLIPAQVRQLVGDHLEVRQAEAWEPVRDGRHVGTVAVEIAGAPVRMTGSLRLEPTADGSTRQVYDGEVRANLPLFAATVEEAAAGAVRRTLEAEERAGREWLEGS
ncbi:uncharacterized protein DUF2505 [Isoptericola sp. CG 20/1183]|uniref:Uncharacterized protein DUF2505 n=1 Tax=Isoptericola halotolerans TaxID=300560 RepID=A0ABX5EHL8_9MICO|nr:MULTISPECIES: DUF2505 domain-containing protein [Isoptericola]PRZ06506.1 uncharacterized protein DUF2505 [Isoptericola halotolerans]PRZ06688.1 uncharacterized protein DUF2505 [Isoptericola sp. CG 20/1183]